MCVGENYLTKDYLRSTFDDSLTFTMQDFTQVRIQHKLRFNSLPFPSVQYVRGDGGTQWDGGRIATLLLLLQLGTNINKLKTFY